MLAVINYSASQRAFDHLYLTDKPLKTVLAKLRRQAKSLNIGPLNRFDSTSTNGKKRVLLSTDRLTDEKGLFNGNAKLFAMVSDVSE